jgi:hypothetical protein
MIATELAGAGRCSMINHYCWDNNEMMQIMLMERGQELDIREM